MEDYEKDASKSGEWIRLLTRVTRDSTKRPSNLVAMMTPFLGQAERWPIAVELFGEYYPQSDAEVVAAVAMSGRKPPNAHRPESRASNPCRCWADAMSDTPTATSAR